MPLEVDGKILDPTNPLPGTEKYIKRVNDYLDELYGIANVKRHKGRINISMHDRHIEKTHGGRGMLEGINFQPVNTIIVNNQSETWRYYTHRKVMGQNIVYEINGKRNFRFTNDGILFDNAKDEHLLFYMVFISDKCEIIPQLRNHQNQTPSPKSWVVDLPEVAAADSDEIYRKRHLVLDCLYDETTDIHKLRTYAKVMGIGNSDDMSEKILRNTLVEISCNSLTKMELFLENINIPPDVNVMATVQTSIDKGIIATFSGYGKQFWCYTDMGIKVGNKETRIKEVLPGEDPIKVVVGYYKQNPQYFEVLNAKLVEKVENPPE